MDVEISLLLQDLWEAITFEMFLKFVLVYFFVIWIAILLWVIKDISNRTDSIVLQIFSILVILFLTPLAIFIYLLIRPSKTLFEKSYDEIEDNLEMFHEIIEEKNTRYELESNCFKCKEPISHDFRFCPSCKTKLKKECSDCKKPIYSNWSVCPYCGGNQKGNQKGDKKVNKKNK